MLLMAALTSDSEIGASDSPTWSEDILLISILEKNVFNLSVSESTYEV